jgi:hypothetical protein
MPAVIVLEHGVGEARLELNVAGVENTGWRGLAGPVGAEVTERLAVGRSCRRDCGLALSLGR